MLWKVLTCPQCSAPLPKQARWRMVTCPFCRATVGLGQQMVEAASFRQAWQRALAAAAGRLDRLDCGRQSFAILGRAGAGGHSQAFVALRLLPTAIVAGLEVADGEEGAAALRRSAAVLRDLHRSEAPGAHAFSRRMPLVLALAYSDGPLLPGQVVLALRHPPHAWGSLAQAQQHFPRGVPATHIVWMWRRILESLAFVHDSGYAHGDLSLGNLMVHPHDHLVHLVGWSSAARLEPDGADALRRPTLRRDLVQSAWAMRSLLAGPTSGPPPADAAPAPLAALLRAVSEDEAATRGLTARALAEKVAAAGREAFGPPRFVHFELPNT